MNFSNTVATVPGVVAPSIVGAFVYEYVRQYASISDYQCDKMFSSCKGLPTNTVLYLSSGVFTISLAYDTLRGHSA